MAKYIDAEKLKDIFEAKGDMSTGTPKQVFYNAAKIVDTLPAADVVEAVRCKDCKYRRDETECPLLSLADFTEDDEFCSMGERKADNDT